MSEDDTPGAQTCMRCSQYLSRPHLSVNRIPAILRISAIPLFGDRKRIASRDVVPARAVFALEDARKKVSVRGGASGGFRDSGPKARAPYRRFHRVRCRLRTSARLSRLRHVHRRYGASPIRARPTEAGAVARSAKRGFAHLELRLAARASAFARIATVNEADVTGSSSSQRSRRPGRAHPAISRVCRRA